jgi:hypothetical protein
MTGEDECARIIDEMQVGQRMRDYARDMYGALLFCQGHLQESDWESEEARLESLDMALRVCEVVFNRVEGVES